MTATPYMPIMVELGGEWRGIAVAPNRSIGYLRDFGYTFPRLISFENEDGDTTIVADLDALDREARENDGHPQGE